MFIKTKMVLVLIILIMLPAVTAQCGAQPEQQRAAHAGGAMVQADRGSGKDQEHEMEAAFEALAPVSLGAGEKLKVVATTNIIGDLVKNVGGDRVELTVMLPVGSDPHTFSPTPNDAATVADAHVIFMNGLNLEEFLNELIENAGGEAAVIPVSIGVKAREFGEGEAHEHEAEGEADHPHEGADPHIWTTPANAIVMVHNIEQALSALDPANAETYETSTEAYEAELEALDGWIQAQVETVPAEHRKLVTDHETLGYYADRYGFEVIGAVIPGSSTNAEPSAQALAGLQEAVSDHGVKAVFVGKTVSPALAQRLAEDMGIELVPLYSDSLGEPGSEAGTYLDYLRYNTKAIVEALK